MRRDFVRLRRGFGDEPAIPAPCLFAGSQGEIDIVVIDEPDRRACDRVPIIWDIGVFLEGFQDVGDRKAVIEPPPEDREDLGAFDLERAIALNLGGGAQ